MITKFSDWSGTFVDGWKDLFGCLRSCFSEEGLAAAQHSILGVSVVYWAIAASHYGMTAQEEQIRSVSEQQDLKQTATDLGAPLWHCDLPLFPGCSKISQDLWMLITPRDAEPRVSARFYQPRRSAPAEFASVALARHKIAYEHKEYLREQEVANRIQEDLERRVRRIVDVQRRLGPELEELRSHHAIDFQRDLAEAGTVLADYSQSVVLLRQLRNAISVNQRNYLINSVALVSDQGTEDVSRVINQVAGAERYFSASTRDEIFTRETSKFQGLCQQLDSEVDYRDSSASRYAITLRAAREQLQISGQRELGQIGHHLSIDSAAVVASVVAVIATEMILKPEGHDQEPIARWSLALALVVGSFALTQALSSGGRGKNLERTSISVAVGLFAVYLAHRYFSVGNLPILADLDLRHWHEFGALLVGLAVGWFSHRWFKRHKERTLRKHAD